MGNVSLSEVVRFCDDLLRPDQFEDWPGAVNGLQAENRGKVSRVTAAVDATLATVRMAVAAQSDLLIVHHGLFWSPAHPWTGPRYEMVRLLVESGLAVYSSHLPLDAHPEIGNNAELCRALGFKKTRPFFFEKGRHLGLKAVKTLPRDELVERLTSALGRAPLVVPGGLPLCRRIGVVTGGAGEQLRRAAEEGVDTFITGEGAHWTYGIAEELRLNLIYGGHYATETFGVKALATRVSERFDIPWLFLDHPTGL